MITYLPATTAPPVELPEMDGSSHPMRAVTQEAAFQAKSWTSQRAKEVTDFFDEIAPNWNERIPAGEMAGIPDALERGQVERGGLCLEIGAGTGRATVHLLKWFSQVIAVDISMEMLKQLDAAPRLMADGAQLPCADEAADAVLLANMFLFPAEVKRVLKPQGLVIWYNSIGEHTPIHLTDKQLLEALGDGWHGIASKWSHATWCVLHRQ